MDWTILKTITWLTGYFEKKGIPEPRLNAEHLIAHTLGIKRLDLYLRFEYALNREELSQLKPLIERRTRREPLQHIIGTQPFRYVEIGVSKGALIPRPETEILVGEVLKEIPTDSNIDILELGVGSGAVIAALAHEREKINLTGTDISSDAIKVAEKNIESYKDRIKLFRGDLFGPVQGQTFDIIVSNPPYICSADWPNLEPEVRDYEPQEALVAGEDGLDFYRRILNDAHQHLRPGGWLFLELGDGQSEAVTELANKSKKLTNIQIKQDLNQKDRVFKAQSIGGNHG